MSQATPTSAIFCVYVYRDVRSGSYGDPLYVGKGSVANRRAEVHWQRGTHNEFFGRVLRKLRHAGLAPIIEIAGEFCDEQSAFACEVALIRQFGRRDLGTGTLCNLTDGGEGLSGSIFTESHRRKIGDAHRGRKRSAETVARISAASASRRHSESTKMKISASCKGKGFAGKKHTEATKEKLSEAAKLRLPRSGFTHSDETKAKIGEASRGRKTFLGKTHSEEARARIGAASKNRKPNLGRVFSEEVRENMRNAQLGKTASDESREKMRISHLGKQHSAETREKIRAAWALRKARKSHSLGEESAR